MLFKEIEIVMQIESILVNFALRNVLSWAWFIAFLWL